MSQDFEVYSESICIFSFRSLRIRRLIFVANGGSWSGTALRLTTCVPISPCASTPGLVPRLRLTASLKSHVSDPPPDSSGNTDLQTGALRRATLSPTQTMQKSFRGLVIPSKHIALRTNA